MGAPESSNTNRLVEVAQQIGARLTWWTALPTSRRPGSPARRVGVTAGASAPEVLVDELIARLKAHYARGQRADASWHHGKRGVYPATRAGPDQQVGYCGFSLLRRASMRATYSIAGPCPWREARSSQPNAS